MGNNPTIEVGLVRYRNNAETTRSFFCVSAKEETKPLAELDMLANLLNNMQVISFGSPVLLQQLFIGYSKKIQIEYVDCKELLNKTLPFTAKYSLERLGDLFRVPEFGQQRDFMDCFIIYTLYRAAMSFSYGKLLHEVLPVVGHLLPGYWAKRVVLDKHARLSLFSKKNILVAGEFKSLRHSEIEKIINSSNGKLQTYPDEKTEIVIAGNTEFPAQYQTHSVHVALLRIRENQSIRLISELELLALLYGQMTCEKVVQEYYRTIPVKEIGVPMTLGKGKDVDPWKGLSFPVTNADSQRSTKLTKKAKTGNKLVDAIRAGSGK